MQCSHLTDDELWRAIIRNTNEMSALFDGQFGARTRGPMFSISKAIGDLERQYQDYAAEVRRRYPSVGLDQALELTVAAPSPSLGA